MIPCAKLQPYSFELLFLFFFFFLYTKRLLRQARNFFHWAFLLWLWFFSGIARKGSATYIGVTWDLFYLSSYDFVYKLTSLRSSKWWSSTSSEATKLSAHLYNFNQYQCSRKGDKLQVHSRNDGWDTRNCIQTLTRTS